MGFILSALLIIISPGAHAEGRTLIVHGVAVEARNIDYFVGSDRVHSFDVVRPTSFPMAHENFFTAYSKVYLATSGKISAILSSASQEILWRTADGRAVPLNCSPVWSDLGGFMSRMVAFHPNGSYFRGCSLPGTSFTFTDTAGSRLTVFGDLEVDPDFRLVFAEKVGSGLLVLGSQQVRLFPTSSVGYHENGLPHFFTLVHQERFARNVPGYGLLTFVQREGKHAYTRLFEDGRVEMGILQDSLKHRELGLNVPAGSGVVFTERGNDLLLTGIVYPETTPVAAGKYQIPAAKLYWDLEKGHYNIITGASFLFTLPKENRILEVPMGSLVGLDKSWAIIGIKVPPERP